MRFKFSNLALRPLALALPAWGAVVLSVIGLAASPTLAATTTGVATNQVLVQLPLSGTNSVSAQGLSVLNATVPGAKVLRTFPHVGWELVQVPAATGHLNASAALSAALGTNRVALNFERHASVIPNDPDYSSQWHLPQINAPAAWNKTTGSSSVVVATLDTGIDLTHPDLVANLWTNPFATASDGYNGTDIHGLNAITGDGSVNDDNGHGTHVAGIIGAVGNNGVGVTGINWNVQLMALKFLDSTGNGYDSDAITCIDYAIGLKAEGVNLIAINNSWGGSDADPALEAAFNAASSAGILLPCAAGNGNSAGVGQDNDTTPTYPANFTTPTVISVAASDQNDNPASFTNYGAATVNLAAPGVSILSTYPSPLYEYDTGTSMATPMVTGAAALIEAANPGFSATQIKSRILATVDVLPQWAGLSTTGGRLDVGRAVNGSIYAISGNVYEVLPSYPHFDLVGASILLNGTQVSSSASDGTFTIANLAAGTYTVSVKLAGFNFATSSYSVTLPATAGTVIPNATVNFVGTGTGTLYAVQGYAYGLNGQPEAGVDVYTNALPNPVAVTNASGYWVMWQRAAGQYWIGGSGGGVNWVPSPAFVNVPANANASGIATVNLYATAPDTTPPTVTITTPADGSSLTTGATTSTGTANDPSGVAMVRLIIANETTNTPLFWDWVNQDWTADNTTNNVIENLPQSGAVNVNWSTSLPDLSTGTYELDVWGRDTLGNESTGAQDAFSTFSVVANTTTNNSLYGISGTVYEVLPSFPQFPLPGADVYLNGVFATSTAQDGTYSLPNLNPGTYSVSVKLAGFTFSSGSVTLPTATGTTGAPNGVLNFTGTGAGTLYGVEGHAYGPNGKPVAGVQIFTNALPSPIAVTDANGAWALWQRAAGQYWFGAIGDGLNWTPTPPFVNCPGSTNSSGIATVNFTASSTDTTPPAVAITTPANGSFLTGGAVTGSGTATDASGVASVKVILSRTNSTSTEYYDWINADWTTNSLSPNIINVITENGTSVTWSVPLPVLGNGLYSLQAWGVDAVGNQSQSTASATSTFHAGSGSSF